MPLQDRSGEHQLKVPASAVLGLSALDETSRPVKAEPQPLTKVTVSELETMMLFLRRSRDRAITIRENAPAGSYLESVLHRTILGIDQELAQLKYLLAKGDLPKPESAKMRPAI